MKKEVKKVVVAFSGGVDSSTSAFLLKKKGFDVSALFMNLFNSKKSEKKAKRLAKAMGIPFKVVDLRKEFKKKVIDYFVNNYKKGLTPNPCVICNEEIKFGLFLKETQRMKADFFATGHYAKVVKKRDGFHLLRASDSKKDQSYFLYRLFQKQLSKVIFPLSLYTKEEVRKLAKRNRIPSFDFTESQEVCFVKDFKEFFKEKLGERRGKIVDKKGNVLGEHNGLWFYTIGQRKGIGLSGGPYFIIGKDLKKNHLIVSKDEKDLLGKELKFNKANWILKKPKFPFKIKAKIRSGHVPASGILTKNKFVFDKPQRAVTPGQSVVFYKGKEVIGGGIII